MLKTDYIKAFTKAIEEADLENENVVRNLENALVLVSAKYEDDTCTNIQQGLSNEAWGLCHNPQFNFGANTYRLKPEPQYKPFDTESFKPYRDCWFDVPLSDLIFKVSNYSHDGVTVTLWSDEVIQMPWEEFMERYTLDGKPAGVEVDGHS